MKSKYSGYMGKIMEVDLTTETVREYPWSDAQRELYLGGKIMAARILCDHLTGKETAFSEENRVVIATGPLTGTGAPSSARFDVSALSPQTGILASSNCGGSFGFHLKKAGYDALILKGKFGISAANDKLPKRLTDVPQDPGNPKTCVPLETMKKTYYQARGWDPNGIPTEKLLRRLRIL